MSDSQFFEKEQDVRGRDAHGTEDLQPRLIGDGEVEYKVCGRGLRLKGPPDMFIHKALQPDPDGKARVREPLATALWQFCAQVFNDQQKRITELEAKLAEKEENDGTTTPSTNTH